MVVALTIRFSRDFGDKHLSLLDRRVFHLLEYLDLALAACRKLYANLAPDPIEGAGEAGGVSTSGGGLSRFVTCV